MTIGPEHLPDSVLPVDPEFAVQYAQRVSDGAVIAAKSRVAIVGLARNLGSLLQLTAERIDETVQSFADYRVIVVENDSKDGTKDFLKDWADVDHNVIVEMSDNGRPQLHGFEVQRMQAMAEYRNRCRVLVQELYPEADYVIAVDLDQWGGWSHHGVLNGIGWHAWHTDAGCMASTSLFKHAGIQVMGESKWSHYDQFAFRLYGWSVRMEPWFPFWLPPPGAEPLPVRSAFGGLGIYKTKAYLACEYSSPDGDCEHVHFHRMMNDKGWQIYLNPAQRCVMSWLVDVEATDGGHHFDSVGREVSC